MSLKFNRRSFIRTSTLISAGSVLPNALSGIFSRASDLFAMDKTGISVVKGEKYYENTIKAVDILGGMKAFVQQGSTVGLLVNSRYNKPGTYVKPEITLAVISMCLAAGAKEIISLENISSSYWLLSSSSKKHSELINSVRNTGNNFKRAKVAGGISLKDAEVQKDFLECDVFINVPIFKDHEGIRKTGCLKNYMGLTSYRTNQYFHFGSNSSGYYSDIPFLSQCIADINLLRKPDLIIADATEFITSNGPFGPGNVMKQRKVVAGTDRIAVDSLGAKILGYEPNDILPIKMAHKHGLGEIDLKKIKVNEFQL